MNIRKDYAEHLFRGTITCIKCKFDKIYSDVQIEVIIDDIPQLIVQCDRYDMLDNIDIPLPEGMRVKQKIVVKGKSSDGYIRFKNIDVAYQK